MHGLEIILVVRVSTPASFLAWRVGNENNVRKGNPGPPGQEALLLLFGERGGNAGLVQHVVPMHSPQSLLLFLLSTCVIPSLFLLFGYSRGEAHLSSASSSQGSSFFSPPTV